MGTFHNVCIRSTDRYATSCVTHPCEHFEWSLSSGAEDSFAGCFLYQADTSSILLKRMAWLFIKWTSCWSETFVNCWLWNAKRTFLFLPEDADEIAKRATLLQEKCGIFACLANGDYPTSLDVAHIVCLGLIGLQHRGQEAAGSFLHRMSYRQFHSH